MPNTAFMHSFYALYQTENGDVTLLKLFVEEALSNNESTIFKRAYELKDITKVANIPNSVLSNKGGLTEDTFATSISISDLFAIVKKYDTEFNPRPVNKNLVNEDGTPKVFYHGTDTDFTEFDVQKQRTRGKRNFGKGIYLTPNRSLAEMYSNSGNVMELYAALESPYEIFS